MPFVAHTQHDQRIVSMDYSFDEWGNLKQSVRDGSITLKMPCCGVRAWPRTSENGVRHFYHRPEDGDPSAPCTTGSESPEHMHLKWQIVERLRELGWDAQPEVAGSDWRADVMAIKDERKVVFEVQLSSQTEEVTRQRQKKYARDGVACVWLMKKVPKALESSLSLLVFLIKQDSDKDWIVYLDQDYGKSAFEVNDFIGLLSESQVRYRALEPSLTKVDAYEVAVECWKCQRDTPALFVVGNIECACGAHLEVTDLYDERVGASVHQAIRSGHIATRARVDYLYNRDRGRKIFRSVCLLCHAPQDNYHLRKPSLRLFSKHLGVINLTVDANPMLMARWIANNELHWCIKQDTDDPPAINPEPHIEAEQLTLNF